MAVIVSLLLNRGKTMLKKQWQWERKILESDENTLKEAFYCKIELSQIKYYRVNCQLVQNTSNRKVRSFSKFGRLQINIQTDLAFLLQHPLRQPTIPFLLYITKAPVPQASPSHPTSVFVAVLDKSCFTFL